MPSPVYVPPPKKRGGSRAKGGANVHQVSEPGGQAVEDDAMSDSTASEQGGVVEREAACAPTVPDQGEGCWISELVQAFRLSLDIKQPL